MGTADGIRAAIGEARATARLRAMMGERFAARYWRRIGAGLVERLKAALRESAAHLDECGPEEFARAVADANLMNEGGR
jgi:hypothetical protein